MAFKNGGNEEDKKAIRSTAAMQYTYLQIIDQAPQSVTVPVSLAEINI